MSQLILFLKTVLPILLIIFVVVLVSILLTRIALRIFLHFAKKKYQDIVQKRKDKKFQKVENFSPKTDETLLKTKEAPRGLVEKMPAINQEEIQPELEEVNIVDIVKPVGFWTSVVLGQKLTYLVSSAKIMNQNSHKGFWTSMVEAQEKAQGRQKGRSL